MKLEILSVDCFKAKCVFRLPKIERQDKLWEFFESIFVDLKCDMFYQKEKKIQIFLKNENYTAARKRRASSESVDSEAVRSSPVKKIKIKKIKKDPQTSSVGSGGSAEKKVKRSSMSPRSVTVPSSSPVPTSSPASPQLSPTKCLQGGAGKKVPIYHNAHKIFRAQQMIARQMKTSSEPEPPQLGSPVSSKSAPVLPPQSKTLSDAAKLNTSSSLVTQYVPPSQPPCLSPHHLTIQPLQPLQSLHPLQPLPKYPADQPPSLLQPVQKGERFSLQQMFSFVDQPVVFQSQSIPVSGILRKPSPTFPFWTQLWVLMLNVSKPTRLTVSSFTYRSG